MNRVRLGRRAEAYVSLYYQSKFGFDLLSQNLRLGACEIDLLMKKGTAMRMIEVRSSSTRNNDDLAWSLVGKKARSLRKSIHALIQRGIMDTDQEFQVDAALVRWPNTGPPSLKLWFNIFPGDLGSL